MKIAEIDIGDQFCVEENDSGHQNSFRSMLNPFSGGKCPNLMTSSLLQRKTLRLHISKNREATGLKFFVRHAFIAIMTQEKFHFNRLMVTLIFGNRASELPPPQARRTTEKAWPDRVKSMCATSEFCISPHSMLFDIRDKAKSTLLFILTNPFPLYQIWKKGHF